MARTNFKIEVELDPIVKLYCKAIECRHNLVKTHGAFCNLKHIQISSQATCGNYEEKKIKKDG